MFGFTVWDVSDMLPYPEPTPAGWYPANGELRYWDGRQWTEHRRPLAQVPVSAYQNYYAAPGIAIVHTDARTNGVELAFAWILALLTLGYMLPWAVAATRGKSNSLAIALLNFLLGWTLLGWLAALVMACMAHQVTAIRSS